MKYLILLAGILLLPFIGNSQDYWHAVGVRGGLSSGFSYKKFLDEENAFEGILSFKRGVNVILLKEIHQPKYNQYSENIFIFHGFGGHFGFLNDDYANEEIKIFKTNLRRGPSVPVIGLDAILGAEYRFETVPIVFGLEYKPYFDIFAKDIFDLHMWDFALSLKYTY